MIIRIQWMYYWKASIHILTLIQFARYSIIKSVVYAFIISSIAAYFGYYVKGGALEVGKASTNAVVMSSIMILLADVIMTHLMLT